jgi:hypothetical protein
MRSSFPPVGWFGITLNEWLFAGFLIALVLIVPKLSDFGEWIARRTGPSHEPDAPPAGDDKTPAPPRAEGNKPRRKSGEARSEGRNDPSDG